MNSRNSRIAYAAALFLSLATGGCKESDSASDVKLSSGDYRDSPESERLELHTQWRDLSGRYNSWKQQSADPEPKSDNNYLLSAGNQLLLEFQSKKKTLTPYPAPLEEYDGIIAFIEKTLHAGNPDLYNFEPKKDPCKSIGAHPGMDASYQACRRKLGLFP